MVAQSNGSPHKRLKPPMKFFVLQNLYAGSGDAVTDYVPADGARMGEAPRCPACGNFVGMIPLLPPLRVELEAWGYRWGDVAFGPGDQILVSDKLKERFVSSGLIGLAHLHPVEITAFKTYRRAARSPPRYSIASINRSRAALDESASGVVRDENQRCGECRLGGIIKRVDRVIIEANTWSGEDLFEARGLPGTILTSERFKRLCDSSDLANVLLIAAEEFHFNHG
jgi:hypothetical protein